MNILVTGAAGFVGKNLCVSLRSIRDGKDKTRPGLTIEEVYEYDIDTDPALLDEYCGKSGLCIQSGRGEPPASPRGIYEGEFRLCRHAS